jgi:cytochrome c556
METNKRWPTSAVLSLAIALAAALGSVSAEAADTSLKDLMKQMNTQVLNGNAQALAPIFDAAKAKGKPEFEKWNSWSDQGKAAAAKGDLEGAKATCKPCHDAYRNDYKTKYGSKAP